MAKKHFDFKKFTIFHDKCAMKVGTDGVLLGAWAGGIETAHNILDIGTGSGLIAIMMAQRTDADIWGVDIEHDAIEQARENALATEWKKRLHFIESDIITFHTEKIFEVITCNPPFFTDSLQSPDLKRTKARHNAGLSFKSLLLSAANLLSNNGRFQVILPTDSADYFVQEAWNQGLNLYRRCLIYSKENSSPKRVLLDLLKGECAYPCNEHLIIRMGNGEYSSEYKELTKDYYIHF